MAFVLYYVLYYECMESKPRINFKNNSEMANKKDSLGDRMKEFYENRTRNLLPS